jgi:hypothetical protein
MSLHDLKVELVREGYRLALGGSNEVMIKAASLCVGQLEAENIPRELGAPVDVMENQLPHLMFSSVPNRRFTRI